MDEWHWLLNMSKVNRCSSRSQKSALDLGPPGMSVLTPSVGKQFWEVISMGNIQFNFQGKTAVVTGGAQGIGFEISKKFLQAGANVQLWDYSQEGLTHAEQELKQFSANLKTQVVDVTNRASCEQAAGKIPGKIDFLINNAGITRDKSFAKMSDEDFDAVINTNLTGLFNVTKRLFNSFNGANSRIINMASVVALYGNFGQTNYVATKSGVIGLTKTWAKEFGKKGFTVNAIAPGFIETKMVQAMPKEVVDGMISKVPVARLGQTQDIANTCLYLCTEEASYINGATISVDGGIVI